MIGEKRQTAILDGNEAAARIAFKTNEICAIYPITPSSPMGELADQWSADGRTNLWETVPLVVEMQSEGGAAGAVHGALQTGALTTTFTASQGLLLMIPNMFRIAGELTPAVFHVAARSVACQALSIFGDHSDVMATRSTGFAMLCASSVQEAHDMALIAQASTLEARIPFIHFFDGFRTSHELNKITLLSSTEIREMIREDLVLAHRNRALNPDQPFIRGTAQNPDVYFQARESVNPFYAATPGIVAQSMEKFSELTGRTYHLFDYFGDPSAERVIVLMGSGAEAVRETTEFLRHQGEPVGLIQVHLYRPFSVDHFLRALPETTKAIAVLDRTKEPGALGEPLYQDVVTAISEARAADDSTLRRLDHVVGGRYGLSSKEFTPAMITRIFAELARGTPRNHFTIGIDDDVSHTSLDYDRHLLMPVQGVTRAIFYGLGSDGTVGANKNTIKIIGAESDIFAQGYFVYDSKKSGSRTTSHLRFGPKPIRSTYLVRTATFVACHQFQFVHQIDILKGAATGATFLLNSPFGKDEVWDKLPREMQQRLLEKEIRFYVIDAYRVAREANLGGRINTIMQTCFFAISGVLPPAEAIAKIKSAIEKTYGRKGKGIVQKNFDAVDRTIAELQQVPLPSEATSPFERPPPVSPDAPEFVRNVTAQIMIDRGDELPVSALPVDGTYPSGSSAWEKRNISMFVPQWEPNLCIQCGQCSIVCPHSCIRSRFYDKSMLTDAPDGFHSAPLAGRGFPDQYYTLQVYLEDCTGCTLCVDACPAQSKERGNLKAINMVPKEPILDQQRTNISFFETLPESDRSRVDFSTVRGVQYLRPLFEFSGACAGCGETPYVKLLSQLFGDRLLVANATGCSSIYGGNLPTTPWSTNSEGRGPAWSNSLFEDNAEFGFGFRLSADKHLALAHELLLKMKDELGESLVQSLIDSPQSTEQEIRLQRERVDLLREKLEGLDSDVARSLKSVADHLVRRSVWLVGGDGWAYDIGFGGLDHVLAAGRNVNVLVLDTEVYSNTGGQASKATPLGAVAKFATSGKAIGKKDLALMAIAYGNAYVARVALGANPQQTLLAIREAEAYPGPSLILAYSHCIAHGINMEQGLQHQKMAVDCGYWPLFRYNPELSTVGQNPIELDSPEPTKNLKEFTDTEMRFKILTHTHPERAENLIKEAEADLKRKWSVYEFLASRDQSEETGRRT